MPHGGWHRWSAEDRRCLCERDSPPGGTLDDAIADRADLRQASRVGTCCFIGLVADCLDAACDGDLRRRKRTSSTCTVVSTLASVVWSACHFKPT